MHYERYLKAQIQSWLLKGKVIIVCGARQVGKTTLVRKIMEETGDSVYLNCELLTVREMIESFNPERLKAYTGEARLVVFDEIQKTRDAGLALKLFHDCLPDISIIATGSSSFGLLGELSEPLTGRNIKFLLYPLAFCELSNQEPMVSLENKLDLYLRFGMYPEIVLAESETDKTTLLDQLASDYLFRDVLSLENLRRPEILVKLLKAIALRTGNEVSLRELSLLLKVNIETVKRYLEILERSFVLFSMGSFSRNLRKELGRARKYYFCDTGIRNIILQNTGILENRMDSGALWENFCLVERMKSNQKNQRRPNMYFWRTYDQKEIDLVEEWQGKLSAYEFKRNPHARVKVPREFLETYPGSSFEVIHRDNYYSFIT